MCGRDQHKERERGKKIQQWLFSYLVCHYFLIECERMLERALHKIFFARETPFAIEVFSPLRTVLSEKRACARARARARGHLPNSNLERL